MKKVVWGIVVALVLVGYTWFVAPVVGSVRDDWAFLHASRLYAIEQQQKAQHPAQ